MKNIKKFEDYKLNEDDSFSLNSKGEFQEDEMDPKTGKLYTYEEGDEEKELTAEEFLFDRYKKYFPNAKSFKVIEQNPLPMSRVAKLMEEYYKEKTK